MWLPFAAALVSLLLALAGVLRRRSSVATWFFAAGMTTLGIDSLFTGLSLRASQTDAVAFWLTRGFIVKAFIPFGWLCFSLTYSRGDYRQFLARWRIPLAAFAVLPVVVWFVGPTGLLRVVPLEAPEGAPALQFGLMGKALSGALLIASVLILTNLEQTFRAAVGTTRWRMKFVFVALAVIFGARIYVHSQAILFSAPDLALAGIESASLLIGCVFLAMAYLRAGWAEIDVYPSLAVLRSSMTALIVGGYLFIVGVLAQAVTRFGGAELFQFQAVVVLLGMAGLALLLLSDRVRQRVQRFTARHFRRAQHDSVRIWTLLSQRLANVRDETGLGEISVRLISETFDALSVTLWLHDADQGQIKPSASTAPPRGDGDHVALEITSPSIETALRAKSSPFDLDEVNEPWANALRRMNPSTFPNGGHRWCVSLRAAEQSLGALVLADRVNGVEYTQEEIALLQCIGDQVTSVLLNLRLANEVVRSRELEAFRTMSAFFVHDLKNVTASLNLMLKNLPVHFDDPAFRADALRGVGNTARRIDDLIARLSTLRRQPQLTLEEADLNQLVSEALDRIGMMPNIEVTRTLCPLPCMLADREQIQSVVTNLVLNARDALDAGGTIQVRTACRLGRIELSVVDDGCGMSPAFLKESLFRPFQSTKAKGLGIGLFQSRAIVHAHGGSVQVESESGEGTTFQVSFPAKVGQ
ncbi:MAG TPA: XrtA/PEP-CTERM system histidine kinase PrsK [Vicinamibacterales bacterium]|jgi:putative PEP-CTERM system histidine kinase|nr:XrtA/PEP-CTERM system histidine kinase PrsK [Vicinamibacterales bacterium]